MNNEANKNKSIRFDFPRSFDLAEKSAVNPESDEIQSMMKIINDLYLENRSLITDGYDNSSAYVSKLLDFETLKFPTGYEAFTWTIPDKWNVHKATITLGDKVIADFAAHPLYLMSYSIPFSGTIGLDELKQHLLTDPDRPGAIPYSYSYYRRDWGMSLPYNEYKQLEDGDYKVEIDTSFESGEMKVLEHVLPGESERSIIISAHLDHPGQVSDGLGGVAMGIALMKRLAALPSRRYTYRLVILPENIGSAAYLHHYRDSLDVFKYAIFLEMVTNKGRLTLQQSKLGDTQLDRLAELAIARHEPAYGVGRFRQVICNDEINFDGPGINIPTVTLTRWPYPEYHTSDDNPGAVSIAYLLRSLEVTWDLVQYIENNVYPKRNYQANLMLGPHGLYEDLNVDDTVERVMLAFEGDRSVLEIAELLDIPFERVAKFAERFWHAGVIVRDILEIPRN
jgi:aminopeptidase-like protein